MDQEEHGHSLVTWIVVVGTLLVVIAATSGYVIANPERLYGLFGSKAPTTAPIANVNGPAPAVHTQPAHTKHYSSIFFEFDYPENFSVVSELINATSTADGNTRELFGSAVVILTATGTDGTYTLRINSEVNSERIGVEEASSKAKESFGARPDRGANDSFQNITVVDRPGYKYFTEGRIHIGLPTMNLNYATEITWNSVIGSRAVANGYIGVLEDSFTVK